MDGTLSTTPTTVVLAVPSLRASANLLEAERELLQDMARLQAKAAALVEKASQEKMGRRSVVRFARDVVCKLPVIDTDNTVAGAEGAATPTKDNGDVTGKLPANINAVDVDTAEGAPSPTEDDSEDKLTVACNSIKTGLIANPWPQKRGNRQSIAPAGAMGPPPPPDPNAPQRVLVPQEISKCTFLTQPSSTGWVIAPPRLHKKARLKITYEVLPLKGMPGTGMGGMVMTVPPPMPQDHMSRNMRRDTDPKVLVNVKNQSAAIAAGADLGAGDVTKAQRPRAVRRVSNAATASWSESSTKSRPRPKTPLVRSNASTSEEEDWSLHSSFRPSAFLAANETSKNEYNKRPRDKNDDGGVDQRKAKCFQRQPSDVDICDREM